MPTLEDAISLAAKAHRSRKDKAGAAYIFHPLRVMLRMKTKDERIVAVLHDVVEDTEFTLDDLRKAGYSEKILQSLDYLTKRDGEEYEEFSLGIWDRITKTHQVYIPSIILHREAYYYVDASGRHYPICLDDQIGKNIQEIG